MRSFCPSMGQCAPTSGVRLTGCHLEVILRHSEVTLTMGMYGDFKVISIHTCLMGDSGVLCIYVCLKSVHICNGIYIIMFIQKLLYAFLLYPTRMSKCRQYETPD